MLKQRTYKVYDYDLWRDEYGYYVNDCYETDIIITVNDYTSDREIIKKLKEKGFLKKYLRYKSFEVYGDIDDLYIDYFSQKTGLIPVCKLRLID